jgi:hypothetical protein
MSGFRLILHILGLIFTGALALFYAVGLAGHVLAMAAGGDGASSRLGGLLGTLFGALICLAIFLRLLRRVPAG